MPYSKYLFFTLFFLIVPLASSQAQEQALEPASSSYCSQVLKGQAEDLSSLEETKKLTKKIDGQSPSLVGYNEIVSAWRKLVDSTYSVGSFDSSKIENEIEKTEKSGASESDEANLVSIKSKIDELRSCKILADKNFKKIQNSAHQLIYEASQVRSREIEFLKKAGEYHIFNWSDSYFSDIIREFKVIPLKWIGIFSSKIQKFSNDASAGVEGWLRILSDIFYLALFIGSIIFFIFISYKLPEYISKIKAQLVNQATSLRERKNNLYWVNRFIPYMTWILVILFVQIERYLITGTLFADLGIVFPYITYYAIYRISRIFLAQVLFSYFSNNFNRKLEISKEKVLQSAKRISLFFIWSVVILYTVESAVDKGFIYSWFYSLVKIGAFVLLIFETRNWRVEIEDLVHSQVSDKTLAKYQKYFDLTYVFKSLIFLIVSLSLIAYKRVYRWVVRLEVSKTISAWIFREKIKNVSSEKEREPDENLASEYRKSFFKSNVKINLTDSQDKILKSIQKEFSLWKENENKKSVIGLVGELGAGKSTIINQFLKDNEGFEAHYFDFDQRILDSKKIDENLGKVLSASGQKIVVIDDMHDLFLSEVGGFECLKYFLAKMDGSAESIFWVVGINQHSWNYLDAVLHKKRYFSQIIQIPKWSEAEIKKLIMDMHSTTNYSVSYEKILHALKTENEFEARQYIEEKYFRILWEEAMGNPRVALHLWVHSLNIYNETKVSVDLPLSRYEAIKDFPEELYFLLASIVRHESLRLSDIVRTDDTTMDFVKNAIEVCRRRKLVAERKGQFSVTPEWQNNVILTLSRKNYIYGN